MKITKITLATELISITQNIEAKKIPASHPLYNKILRGTKAQIQEKIEAALIRKETAKKITKKHNTKITENAMARAKAEVIEGKPENLQSGVAGKGKTAVIEEKDAMFEGHPIFNPTKNEESKMEAVESKFEMKENAVVVGKDATWDKWGKTIKAKPAAEAVVAVKGIAAVEEVKTQPAIKANKKKGIEAQDAVAAVAAVKAVKAVKAKPATEATSGSKEMYIKCASQEIAEEVAARMADQGLIANYDELIFEEEGKDCFLLSFSAEDPKTIRAAFKNTKAKDGYNKAGLDIIKAQEKAKEKADAAAKKESDKKLSDAAKKKEKDAQKAEPKETGKKSKPKAEAKAEEEKTEDGGWPDSDGFDE